MLWAVCCICFFGFFRLGEITAPTSVYDAASQMSMSDVAVDCPKNPSVVSLHLRRAKTDQLGKGTHVYLSRAHNELCPVSALLAYIGMRGQDPGPLFRQTNGSPLCKTQVVQRVRKALEELGYNQTAYAGHSFRIGAATTAAAAGLNDSTIQTMGRWSSSAFTTYIRLSQRELTNFAAKMSAATAEILENGGHAQS